MQDLVQVKGTIPRPLKCRAFAALALRDQKFNHWLRMQMETWLAAVEVQQQEEQVHELVGPQARG